MSMGCKLEGVMVRTSYRLRGWVGEAHLNYAGEMDSDITGTLLVYYV